MAQQPQRTGKQDPESGFAERIHDRKVPTHVIWGKVESIAESGESSSWNASGSMDNDTSAGGRVRNLYKNLQFLTPSDDFSSTSQGDADARNAGEGRKDPPNSRRSKGGRNTGSHNNHARGSSDIRGLDEEDNVDCEEQTAAVQQTSNISDERLQELMSLIPRDEMGDITSIGSIWHADGECKPCRFVHAKIGCQNGARCEFCHFQHKQKNVPRPCKGKRDRYRKLIGRMENMIDADPENLIQTMFNLPPSIRDDQARKAKLMAKMANRAAQVRASADGIETPKSLPQQQKDTATKASGTKCLLSL